MGEITGISWTDHTFNPWWGCWKIAPECKNCYADATAHRFVDKYGELWDRTGPRRFFPEDGKHWKELDQWDAKAERDGVIRKVFVGSMCDWAERHPVPEIAAQQNRARAMLWERVKRCTSLVFLMLTKRPEDAHGLVPWMAAPEDWASVGVVGQLEQIGEPWRKVWMGVTAGTRETLATNVSILRGIPAAVRFISCEPILEDIPADEWDRALGEGMGRIDWLIVGDESGSNARDAQPDWVRSAREAALRHGVAFHFKQWAGRDVAGITGRIAKDGKNAGRRKIHLPILDGKQWAQFPGTK